MKLFIPILAIVLALGVKYMLRGKMPPKERAITYSAEPHAPAHKPGVPASAENDRLR